MDLSDGLADGVRQLGEASGVGAIIDADALPIEDGATLRDVARQVGVNPGTLCRWQRRYGGMEVGEARRMFLLEKENLRLKKIVAELELDRSILKEALEGKP